MPGFVFLDPNNFANKYYTLHANDANVPAGYVMASTADGSFDPLQQTYQPGVYSGGFPSYGTTDAQGTYGQQGHPPGELR